MFVTRFILLIAMVSAGQASNIIPLKTSNQFEDFLSIRDMDAVLVTNSDDYDLIQSLAVAYPNLRFGHLSGDAASFFPPSTIRTYNTFSSTLDAHQFHWKSKMHLDYWIINTTTPEIVSPNHPIFQVVYDYTDHHFLSFGLEIHLLQRLAEIYKPNIIFIDVPIDNSVLIEKFKVKSIPSAVLANVKPGELSYEHLDLDEDTLVDILSKTFFTPWFDEEL